MTHILANMTPNGWQPGIGDPTFMGWLTVFLYLIAAMLCSHRFRVVLSLGDTLLRSRALLLWAGLALLLLGLGVNKQLDLQTWLTATGRALAREQGWYDHRRFVQAAFVCIMTMLLLTSFIHIARRLPQASRRIRFALLGTAFLLSFVAIRAASFHHVDVLLKTDLAGAKINWILEVGGICFIAIAAVWRCRAAADMPAPWPSAVA